MLKFSTLFAHLAGVSLILSLYYPASAQEFTAAAAAKPPFPVTFVSGLGTDSAACGTEVRPCRTFKMAIGQTSAGGEIKELNPADYGPVIITKAISITGVDGAGINSTPSGDTAITINAAATDTIKLSNLILDGTKIANVGIGLNSGGSLTISNLTVQNFATGITLQPGGALKFLIANTLVLDNKTDGVDVVTVGNGTAQGTLDHVTMNKNNGGGLSLIRNGTVAAVDCIASDNGGAGFNVGFGGGFLRLARSTATGNATGVSVNVGVGGVSFGDNHINGNGTDVSPPGSLAEVGTQ